MTRRIVMALWAVLIAGCDSGADGSYQGYVEGEYVTVAAPLGGTVLTLNVAEGSRVARGEKLFELDTTAEEAQLAEATERASGSGETPTGAGSSQQAALEAARDQAAADHALTVVELRRAQRLFAAKVIDRATFDVAETREKSAAARLAQTKSNVTGAAASVRAGDAVVTQARWRLDQMRGTAPAEGIVTLVARREGEWVPPGGGVLRLLPDAGRVVRFFVAQAELPSFTPGTKLSVVADGAPAPVEATVTRTGATAEYTPPFIYSRESREKMVFLVEARPDRPTDLPPGLPVTVTRAP
ncbi:MAG: HlyD family efflux transporter periplasmic adaptor subunit [Nitrospinae bacterium]|nr:HlyD family efflux transporter periplasmic adaptor subunit [Nitrospinota bacterium]